MRLLDTATLRLQEFIADIPPYAILSHTWRAQEATLQDLVAINRDPSSEDSEAIRQSVGYQKIVGFANELEKMIWTGPGSTPAASTKSQAPSSRRPSTPCSSGTETRLFATCTCRMSARSRRAGKPA